jgi:molecular chaperone DnaK
MPPRTRNERWSGAKNHAEALVHRPSVAQDYGSVSASDKSAIEAGTSDLKSAGRRRRRAHPRKTNALAQVAMKLGEAMYKATQGGPEGGGDQSGTPKNEGVVDAEFEEVDDDERKKSA